VLIFDDLLLPKYLFILKFAINKTKNSVKIMLNDVFYIIKEIKWWNHENVLVILSEVSVGQILFV